MQDATKSRKGRIRALRSESEDESSWHWFSGELMRIVCLLQGRFLARRSASCDCELFELVEDPDADQHAQRSASWRTNADRLPLVALVCR